MRLIFDLSRRAGRLLAGLCCVLLALVAVFTVVDVTVRELGFQPIVGRTAAAEWALLYIATLGSPFLVREKGHVFVDALLKAWPGPVRWTLEKLIYLACFGLCLYLCGWAAILGWEAWVTGDYEIRSFDMPRWLIYLPFVLGFLLMAVEFLRYLIGRDSMYDSTPGEQEAAL